MDCCLHRSLDFRRSVVIYRIRDGLIQDVVFLL